MRILAPAALVLFLVSPVFAAERHWNDTLRDVYIDGVLDRTVQTFVTSEPRLFALVPPTGDVLVLDPAKKEIARAARSQFTIAADRNSATTQTDLERTRVGTLALPESSTYIGIAEGRSIAMVAHQSRAGLMSEGELWETAPVWKTLMERYEPDAHAVARLRKISEPVTLRVVLATWCGDSKRYVPQLLKAIHAAANPKITVELVGIGPEFLSPLELIRQENIVNVPMVIALREGKELGRYIETPAASTIEEDVVDLVAGSSQPHPGRWERRTKLVEGTYELRDRAGRKGVEHFEIWDTKDEGLLVHSTIEADGEETETWATLDKSRKPTFAEVTYRRADGGRTRVRHRRSGNEWVAVARGDRCGIVEQHVAAPESLSLVTPATPTLAWALATGDAYVVPRTSTSGLGTIEPLQVIARGSAKVGRAKGDKYDCGDWTAVVDPESRLPLHVKFEDGAERRLVKLTAERK